MTGTNRFVELYPDVAKDGGITCALKLALSSIGSSLEANGGRNDATVTNGNRFAQVSMASEIRQFSFSFWDRGVALVYAGTPDLIEVVRSIHAWLDERTNTTQIKERFPFVSLNEIAGPFEKDEEVAWTWQRLEDRERKHQDNAYLPIIIAARKQNELGQLFPFTSHDYLCFSRFTGYPYSLDCPYCVPTKDGLYQVFDSSNTEVGRGDAESAVQILIEHLPPNCGPARKGTADDL